MYKFVAVINKKVEIGRAMNALGHMALGLGGSFPDKELLQLDTYTDKSNSPHKNISDHPFIVLKADNSSQIRTLRLKLEENNVTFVDFIDTMTVGTFEEQKQRTRETLEENLEYFGICFFGEKETIDQLTKKFSLWR